jgi:salicylate hydroxylase
MLATSEEPNDNLVSNGHASERLNRRKTENVATPHHSPNLIASYPSQALHFLEKVHEKNGQSSPSASPPEQARHKMTIIVVGAGLGELSLAIALARRGHSVRVLEQAAKLGEVRSAFSLTIWELIFYLGWRRNTNTTKLREAAPQLGCF